MCTTTNHNPIRNTDKDWQVTGPTGTAVRETALVGAIAVRPHVDRGWVSEEDGSELADAFSWLACSWCPRGLSRDVLAASSWCVFQELDRRLPVGIGVSRLAPESNRWRAPD